jgi:hypothetical protein
MDPHPRAGWVADWKIEDRFGYLAPGADVHLRSTDLTEDARAYTAESWTVRNATSTEQFWIPAIMVRREAAQGPLTSTFVSVLEPYEGKPFIAGIRRLPAAEPVLEITLADGRKDVVSAGRTVTFKRVPAGAPR